jgi:hypothetical protein
MCPPYWPLVRRPPPSALVKDEFRHALRALGDTDRALEVNTAGRLRPDLVR